MTVYNFLAYGNHMQDIASDMSYIWLPLNICCIVGNFDRVQFGTFKKGIINIKNN